MSDDDSDGAGFEQSTEPVEPPVDVTHTGDWFLEGLVAVVDTGSQRIRIPLTLMVGGLVVEGELAAASEYFTDFGKTFSASFRGGDDEGRSELRRRFDGLAIEAQVSRGGRSGTCTSPTPPWSTPPDPGSQQSAPSAGGGGGSRRSTAGHSDH